MAALREEKQTSQVIFKAINRSGGKDLAVFVFSGLWFSRMMTQRGCTKHTKAAGRGSGLHWRALLQGRSLRHRGSSSRAPAQRLKKTVCTLISAGPGAGGAEGCGSRHPAPPSFPPPPRPAARRTDPRPPSAHAPAGSRAAWAEPEDRGHRVLA